MDRLPELRAATAIRSTHPELPSEFSPTDGEAQVHIVEPPNETDKEVAEALSAFFQDVEMALDRLTTVEKCAAELQVVHSENMQTVDEKRSAQLREEIDQLSMEINNGGKGVKDTIDVMSKKITTLKESTTIAEANSAVIRIGENQSQRLLMKLTLLMHHHQQLQAMSEANYKAQTKRRIKISYTNSDGSAIDDETVNQLTEQVLENNAVSYIFQQSKDVLASIIETRNDIYRIERSMRELNQLFSDLAYLVNEQGEIMDVILENIRASTRYVEAGRKELKKARKYQKRSRKKMIIIIVCLLILVVLFVVVGMMAGFIPK